jgi:hypothetical protein
LGLSASLLPSGSSPKSYVIQKDTSQVLSFPGLSLPGLFSSGFATRALLTRPPPPCCAASEFSINDFAADLATSQPNPEAGPPLGLHVQGPSLLGTSMPEN